MTKLSCAAVVTMALVIGACGSGDDDAGKATVAEAVATAGTPFPTDDFSPLRSGVVYSTRKFQPSLSITPGKGEWMAELGDRPDHLAMAVDVGPGQGILGFHHMTQVFDPDAGGAIPGDAIEGPADFAEWLTSHPHLKATEPKSASLLGLEGVRIDIKTKSSPKKVPEKCGKYNPPCVPLFFDGFAPVMYGSDWKGRFYVLDQGDRQLVVEQAIEEPAKYKTVLKQLDEQLDAVSLEGM